MEVLDLFSWDVITAGCVIFILTLFYRANSASKKLPPGPFRWPIIGNMGQMSGNIRKVFSQFRKKYGDVFSIRLGSQLYVVVNGYETLKEVFVDRAGDFSDRTNMYSIRTLSKGKGLLSSRAEFAIPLRNVCSRSINDKQKVDEYVLGQLKALQDILQKYDQQPFDIQGIFFQSVANIISGLVCGRTFNHDDERLKTYTELMDESIKLTKITGILDIFPCLLNLPGDRFKAKKLVENSEKMRGHAATLIDECKQSPGKSCMVDDLLKVVEEKRQLGNPYTDEHLLSSVNGMFSAGMQVTCINLTWAILHLINNRQLQQTLRSEVIKAVGKSTYPSESNRKDIPQCRAFVEEVLRFYDVAHLAVPHGMLRDVNFRDFVIPKGAIVLPNLDSVLADPEVFPGHDQFNHERFLGQNGDFVSNEKVIPFGIGERRCLGYQTARTILLVVTAFLVQRYELLPAEDDILPSMEGKISFTYDPKPFLMRVKKL